MTEQAAAVGGSSAEGERSRRFLQPSASTFILAAACAVQAVRIFHGLDLNDEMQYYGELMSLVENGRLFATDLFLQQMVYMPLYPFFKVYVHVWGSDSLILAGRILFACFTLWIFRGVRVRLLNAGVEPVVGSVCALAVTFCVPLYNIYAFSYNSVAMGIAALCFAEMFQWRRRNSAPSRSFWSLSLVTLLLVYPPLAIGIGSVLLLRLLVERDHHSILRIAASGCAVGVVATIVTLQFTSVAEFLRAVEFTRATEAGAGIFHSGLNRLALVWGLVVFGLALDRWPLPSWAEEARASSRAYVVGLMAVISIVAIRQSVVHNVASAALIMVASGCLLTAWMPGRELRELRKWITVTFLFAGSVMAASSGNGFGQIHGAAMLATPFYFALATMSPGSSHASPSPRRAGACALGLGMLAVYTVLYLSNPYCDPAIWKLTAATSEAPAFRHLRISEQKARAISLIRAALFDVEPGSRLMVVGAHPWLYMVTNTRPDTDMIFMHPIAPAMEIVATRLANRQPEYLVIAGEAVDAVTATVTDLLASGAYTCVSRPIEPWLVDATESIGTFYDMLPSITVCRAPSAARIAE